MLKVLSIITSLVCLLTFGVAENTFAELPKEDSNDPISFNIEMLNWEEVNEILPKYSKFDVIDVETGMRFSVQRRAGSKHADVQPLTKKDTKIMKEIYHGKWSWKRRAIIILEDDMMIAASMHGMPHGAGALRNGFPGHFCIHFFGSTTHGKKNVDLSHKVMIYKAAGKFDQYIHEVDPYELIGVFIVAMNHHDEYMLDKLTTTFSEDETKELQSIIENINTISIRKIHMEPDNNSFNHQLIVKIPVELQVFHFGRKPETKTIEFILQKHAILDQWKIDGTTFLDEYQGS